VDCVLRVGPLAPSSLVARPLGHFALINCASPAYLARHGTPQALGDLAAHRVVDYLSPTTGRPAPWESVQPNGQTATRTLPAQVAANHVETYIACALAGLGLIQIPAYDVREHLESGTLVEVLPHARAAPMPVHVLYPHRRHLSLRVQGFIAWLQEQLTPCLDAPGTA
jgi:DNA-binding transcriptional LysR family regulator